VRSITLAAVTAALAGVLSFGSAAQLGDPGYAIDSASIMTLGSPFEICFTAPPNSSVLLLIGTAPGSTPTKFGTLGLALPVQFLFVFPMNASGQFCLPPNRSVPCYPELAHVTMYMQLISVGPDPGQRGISNVKSIQIMDAGACSPPGQLVTYTQGAWGAKCNGGNAACLLQAHFASVYPNGLILGDPDGPDGDSEYALLLTSAQAVADFLPEGSTRKPFTKDDVDPTKSDAGVLSGQLAAAKINVDFDMAGLFDSQKSLPAVKLADMIYVADVQPILFGRRVADVIALTDLVISGAVAMPVDLDGDSVGDLDYADLSQALDVLNQNFDNGTLNNHALALP